MKVPPEVYHTPVNRCIYCGKTEPEARLSDEHIIPFSFGGHHVLPKASCQECCLETHAIEGKCCNHMFKSLRVLYGVPTRRPKKRPTHLLMYDGKTRLDETAELVPVAEAPGIAAFPEYSPARVQIEDPSNYEWIRGYSIIKSPKDYDARVEALKRRGFEKMATRADVPEEEFGRVLAKIAHAYLVSKIGIDAFEHDLAPVVLGKDKDIAKYVGGVFDNEPLPVEMCHWHGTDPNHKIIDRYYPVNWRIQIHVYIRLFTSISKGIFTYKVVCGHSTLVPEGYYTDRLPK